MKNTIHFYCCPKWAEDNKNNGQCFTFLLLVNRYQPKVKYPKDICSKSSFFTCETHMITRWTSPSMPYHFQLRFHSCNYHNHSSTTQQNPRMRTAQWSYIVSLYMKWALQHLHKKNILSHKKCMWMCQIKHLQMSYLISGWIGQADSLGAIGWIERLVTLSELQICTVCLISWH